MWKEFREGRVMLPEEGLEVKWIRGVEVGGGLGPTERRRELVEEEGGRWERREV